MNSSNVYEEVSFFDLWQVVRKHKKTFWTIFLIIFILGSLLAIVKPQKYSYSQTISIASYAASPVTTVPVKPIAYFTANILPVLWPKAISDYNNANKTNVNAGLIALDVNPTNDRTIILSIKDFANKKDLYVDLFNRVYEQINAETAPIISEYKNALNAKQKFLEDQLPAQAEMNHDNSTLIGKISGSNNDVASKYFAINAMQTRINLITQTMDKIRDNQLQLVQLRPTTKVTDVIVSAKPIGPAKSVLILLSFIIGLAVGFVAVFVKEFFVKIKSKQQNLG